MGKVWARTKRTGFDFSHGSWDVFSFSTISESALAAIQASIQLKTEDFSGT
jgi:hypothetical protein